MRRAGGRRWAPSPLWRSAPWRLLHLQVLALHERPSGGRLWLQGVDATTLRPRALRALRRSTTAWVAQRPTHSLYAHLTATGNLHQVARLRRADHASVGPLLDRLGVSGRAGARTDALSGGEQQRLAVAAAVLGGPAVLLADEPTAELDDESAVLVLTELRRCADRGSAVVFATHDPRAVGAADRVLHLRHGVLSSEREAGRTATVPIDASGRDQLPPEALPLFPDAGAEVVVVDGEVRLRAPGADPA